MVQIHTVLAKRRGPELSKYYGAFLAFILNPINKKVFAKTKNPDPWRLPYHPWWFTLSKPGRVQVLTLDMARGPAWCLVHPPLTL